jgi:hypothetical protein
VERWEEEEGMENHTPQKSNLIQDSEGDEENRYPVPDPNKTKINNTNKPINAYKKYHQRRNLASNH